MSRYFAHKILPHRLPKDIDLLIFLHNTKYKFVDVHVARSAFSGFPYVFATQNSKITVKYYF